jgi:hypothetical protein
VAEEEEKQENRTAIPFCGFGMGCIVYKFKGKGYLKRSFSFMTNVRPIIGITASHSLFFGVASLRLSAGCIG